MSDDVLRDAIASGVAALVPLARVPAVVGYGVDLICHSDLDPRLAETDPTTIQSLAQDLFHRVTTRRGSNPDDPHLGIDVRDMLSAGLTTAQISSNQEAIATECKQDDRVQDARVSLSYSFATNELSISIRITPVDYTNPAAKPFTLIIAVSSSAAILSAIEAQS